MPRPERVRFPKWSWPTVLLGLLLTGPVVHGQSPEGAEDEPYLPGLHATYRDSQGQTAARVDHQLAFHWGATPPDPRLAEGEFEAVWQGQLYIQTNGAHRFFLHGSGTVELKIAGQVVVARQTLRNGWLESPPVSLASDFL
jgi:hypothetical protein